ncbi:hypothetical protein Clacol_004919 [Clathrus columnatus]|uniref:NACHT domain-containing protein n=1 Tax=Clathrus columnatus TaxID=1419009 RepID=A0AAV5AAT2_9AGAM|nr:hypothetical protein Clacol_004919 [Clathrus columnatus]
MESSVKAASRALESTRNVTGQRLEHDNKPGYFKLVGQSVVKRLSLFTNLVQKIADAHPYSKTAWMIISSAVTVITDTQKVDQDILDLFDTLDSTYKFIEDAANIENHLSYEHILSSLAKQTVECAYFIRDYAKKHNFWIRVGTNIIGEPIKLRVQSYQDAFAKLLEEFQTRSALHTEIAVGRLLELNQSISENLDLDYLPYAAGAGLHTGKQCLPGTRIEVLNEITGWINDADEMCPRLFWLAGPAGAGKSAIAHSIALLFKSIHRLGSFFCFDRNYPSERRREKIFSTIARDLADLDPQIKRELAKAIKNEASLRTTTDLQLQWEKFIFEPLRVVSEVGTGPILIVIDGLDESGDPILRRELLKTLEKKISSLPVNIRFLITSRPEKDILLTLEKLQSCVRTKMMNTILEAETKRDILTYFGTNLADESSFFGIARLKQLVEMSQGLFQWAYLASEFLIGLGNGAGSTVAERYEDLINTDRIQSINDPLDAIYNQILSSIFDSSNPRVMARFRSVIGSIVVASRPLTLDNLIALRGDNVPLSGRETDVKVVIQYLGSLLSGIHDPSSTIRLLHLSFREYLLDHNRSHEFSVDPLQCHQDIAFGCLRTMMEGLKFNICNISSSYMRNADDDKLPERISSSISSTLSYSTRFWAHHVSSTVFDSLLAEKVEEFLYRGFLLWLEVLSLLGAVNTTATRSMSDLISWCSEKETHADLYNLAVDGKRFIQLFGGAISESAPHVYLSALPFCPQDSIIYRTFINRFPKTLRIASKPLQGWPLVQRRVDMKDITRLCFSHGGKYLAIGLAGGIFKVLNSQTLSILWTVEPLQANTGIWIADMHFSGGDKSLIVATNKHIHSFNILTGRTTTTVNFNCVCTPVLSHDAKFLALIYSFKEIRIMNLEAKEEVIYISLAPKRAFCYGFSNSNDPSFVVYLGMEAGVQIINLEKGSVLHLTHQPPLPQSYEEFYEYQIPKRSTISSNGRQIIFDDYSYDRSYIWDFRDSSLIALEGYGQVMGTTINPKGDYVVIHTHNKLILRHLDGNELHCENTNIIGEDAFSKRLAISNSERLDILELDGWQTSSVHLHHSTSTPCHLPPIAASSDGKYFFIGCVEKGHYEICDVDSGKPIRKLCLEPARSLDFYQPTTSRAFSFRGRYFGYVLDEKLVKLYDIESDTVKTFPFGDGKGDMRSIAFSQDERLVAILDLFRGTIEIWDIDSSELFDGFLIPKSTKPIPDPTSGPVPGLTQQNRPKKFKASSTFQYFVYLSFDGDISLFNRTSLISLDFLPCEPTILRLDSKDFLFSLDEKYMLLSWDTKIYHINLITEEYQAVTLQGIHPVSTYHTWGNRCMYFTSHSEARLIETLKAAFHKDYKDSEATPSIRNNKAPGWGIWDCLSGHFLYSVFSPEYPDLAWGVLRAAPVNEYFFTSTTSFMGVMILNARKDESICFSSDKRHSLQNSPLGSCARLRSDGWVVTQNDELLFWVPQHYHQILHLPMSAELIAEDYATVARGIPLLDYNATTALSLTLTPNQVEAICARLLLIKNPNGKIHIGNTTVKSFKSGEETGVCEMSNKPSSSVKTPALSAPIVGKLTIRRGLDEVASDLRRATEAEKVKKKERSIVVIDAPIITGKNSRASGVVSQTKKATTSRVASSQINPPTPRPTIGSLSNNPSKHGSSRNSTSSSSTTLPTTSNSTINNPDFNTLRSRLLHFIAPVTRPKEVAISDFINAGQAADREADVRRIFEQVAQEIPGPKKSDPAYWKWDLKSDSWLEVRPFGFPGYTPDERTQASRRARVYSRISPQNPVWRYFSMSVGPSSLASGTAAGVVGPGGGIVCSVKNKKAAAKPRIPKTKSTSKASLEDKKETSPKRSLPADGSTRKRKLADMELEPTSDLEEGEVPSKASKRRRIIGLPQVSKHDTNVESTKKAPATEKDCVGLSTSTHNPDPQGIKAAAAASSHRTNSKVRERDNEKEKDHRNREKGKERAIDKESGRERQKREMEKAGSDYEKEKHPFNHFCTKTDGTKESVDRIKDNKGPTRVKRKRRTPSFSSDDEKDETQPPGPKRAATSTSRSTFMSTTTSKANVTTEHKSMSNPVALSDSKEGLEYQYGMYYAKYLHLTSQFYTEKAKVEAAFALGNDENTVGEGSDLMDIRKLYELCEEYHQTKMELERIRKAHRDLDANTL